MWRRVSSQLRAFAPWRSNSQIRRPYAVGDTVRCAAITANKITARSISVESASATRPTKPRVEDILPIATGLEREEMEAELQGKKRFDMDAPVGPFGTKEAPAVIQSYYDKRIVGCSGGEGEDEHDVVWFLLEKAKPHECPVCSQYFTLEVVGPGGPPDGHGDEQHHHH